MSRFALTLLPLLLFLFPVTRILAESISVSLQVGSTLLTFSGYTSPSALVVIKEDGNVVGTTTSNASGDWTHTLTVAVPTLHTYDLSATDTANHSTSTVSYNLNVVGNTTTTLTNIVLPPTLTLLGSTAFGTTYPNSSLTLTFDTGNSATFPVGGTGAWSYDLSALAPGTYTLTATSTVGSYLSLESTPVTYTATAASPSPTPTPTPSSTPTSSSAPSSQSSAPSASPSPSLSPSPTPAPFFLPLYDQNQDGHLTLSELYDVIKNWLSAHLPCDLNRDQACNLIDLSILLYYFER